MLMTASELYKFGCYSLDMPSRTVTRSGEVVTLAPKTFDLLALLVKSNRRLLSKNELMAALWPDTFVEEANRGLYFLAVGDVPYQPSIDFFEFATGKRETVLKLGKQYWYGMALSPDQKSLLYSVIDNAGGNLMLVENFR